MLAVTADRDVAWTGAGRRDRGERRRRRRDRPGRRVDAIDEHLIEAEVGDVEELPRRIGRDAVRVRSLLPIRVDARALVLDERRRRLQRAVGRHRIGGDAAAAVVGGEHHLAGDADVARAAPTVDCVFSGLSVPAALSMA